MGTFIPTKEQEDIAGAFVGEVMMNFSDDPYRMGVIAPAGTGKTSTTLHIIKSLETASEGSKKIGYFVFNRFMVEDIKRQVYIQSQYAENEYEMFGGAKFFTYHGFFLDHAKNNTVFRKHFYDQNGNFLVDFAKEKYTQSEIERSIQTLIGRSDHELVELIKVSIDRYLKNEKLLAETTKGITLELFGKEERQSDIESYSGMYSENIKKIMLSKKDRILSVAKNVKIDKSKVGAIDLTMLFIAQSIKLITKQSRFTQGAYYKEVFMLSKAYKIDLFDEFDAIIVDEWQDADPMFKTAIENTKKPVLVLGDSDQSVYAFRGAVNMMEHAEKNYDIMRLTYSFRFRNDIAAFSKEILKLKNREMEIHGRYSPSIKSINNEVLDLRGSAKTLEDWITKIVEKTTYEKGLSCDTDYIFLPKKEIGKLFSRNKTAFISRNNATLIGAINEILHTVTKTMQDRLSYKAIYNLFQKELDGFTKDEIENLVRGIFPDKIEDMIDSMISMIDGISTKGMPIQERLRDESVLQALVNSGDEKYKPLTRKSFAKRISSVLKNVSVGDVVRVSLTKRVSEDLKKIRKGIFSKRIEAKISKELSEPYSKYRQKKPLKTVLQNDKIRKVIKDTEYGFLLDEEKFKQFIEVCEELSKRGGMIKSDDKDANIVFTTAHGSKGKTYQNTYVFHDLLQTNIDNELPDEECNLSYVAATRCTNKLYFVSSEKNTDHPMFNLFVEKQTDILKYVENSYTYTYPHEYVLDIKKINEDLFGYTIKKDGDFVSMFTLETPMESPMMIYDFANNAIGFKYFSKGEELVNLDGNKMNMSRKDRKSYSFQFGMGKTKIKKKDIANITIANKVSMQQETPAVKVSKKP